MTEKHQNPINIYDYLDYQEFLRDFYLEEKKAKSFFSYRYIEKIVGIDASLIAKIFQGKRHLTSANVLAFVKLFVFDSLQTKYFTTLVLYGKAKEDEEIKKHFSTLMMIKPKYQTVLEKHHYKYFQKWYYVAIRAALEIYSFDGTNVEEFSKIFQYNLNSEDISDAITVLNDLKLIVKDENGYWKSIDSHLTTDSKMGVIAVREFQKSMMTLAQQSLNLHPKEIRDISSLTLSLSSNRLEAIKEIISEARASIVKVIDQIPEEECDSVYQLNMQLIPLALTAEKQRENEKKLEMHRDQ